MDLYDEYIKNKDAGGGTEAEPASAGGFEGLTAQILKKRREKQDPALKLPKGTDPFQAAVDYYVPDKQEQLAAAAKAADKPPLLLDILENFQRLSYGLIAGQKALAKSYKYGDKISDVPKHVWKGLTLEEKGTLRDVGNVIAPQVMRDLEEATKFKVFGVDTSVAGVGLAVTEMVQDPLNLALAWMPTHYLTKAGKLGFLGATKATRAAGEAALGAEKVDKIIKAGADLWYKKIAPHTDIASIFNRTYGGVGEGTAFTEGKRLKGYLQQFESAPHLTSKEIKAAMRVTDVRGKVGRLMNLAETTSSFEVHHKISDELVELFGELRAQKLGMKVDDMLHFDNVKKTLDDLSAKEITTIPKETMDFFEKEISEMKTGGAKAITQLLLEDRGINNAVKRVVKGERMGSELLAKGAMEVADTVWKEAIEGAEKTLSGFQKALKSENGVVMDLVKNDIENSSKILRAFHGDLKDWIATGTPEALGKVRARFGILKQDLSRMTRYGIDETKLTLKSDMKFRKIGSLVRLIQTEVGEMGGKLATNAQADVAKMLSRHMGILDREIKSVGSVLSGEFKRMQRTASAAKGLQAEIASKFNARSSELMSEIAVMNKFRAAEKRGFEIFKRKADKFEIMQAAKYRKNLKAINSGALDQEIMRGMKAQADAIEAKHILTLDPSLHRAFRETRKILDEQGSRLRKAGLTRGFALYYTPRQIAKEFQEKFERVLPHLRTNMGFLRSREFRLNREFVDWVEKSGGKVENDLAVMMMEDVTNGRIKIARQTFVDGLIKDFGSKEAVPMEMMKGLDFMFGAWKTRFPPLVQKVMGFYGKTLNMAKFMLTAPNPAFHGRNWLSSIFQLQTTAGVVESINPANYFKAIKLKFGGKGAMETVEGIKTFDQIREFMDNSGYLAASLTRGNIERSAKMMFKRYNIMNPLRWVGNVFEVGAHSEDMTRTVAFIANLKTGKTMEQALDAAVKSMFNYNFITSPVDKALDGVLGFWTFTRRNLPAQVMNMLDNPQQYSLLSRTLDRIANREQLTAEELGAINGYDRESLTLFGQVIDGVREMTSLGFTPLEQANQTINAISRFDIKDIPGSLGNVFSGRVTPLASFWLDYNYSYDSFTKREAGYNLPGKYTAVIPKPVQKFLGLTAREVPVYKMGEIVGKETRLFGDPKTIAMIRRFPVTSRQLSDVATFVESMKKDKTLAGLLRGTTGIRQGGIDTVQAKKGVDAAKREAMIKLARKRGAPRPFEILSVPKEEKKTEGYREFVKEKKAARRF